jgi:hypothetical protein
MRKGRRGVRIVLEDAIQLQLEDFARRDGRALANAAAYCIKMGLAAKRAEQRPVTEPERNAETPPQ